MLIAVTFMFTRLRGIVDWLLERLEPLKNAYFC